MPRTNPDALPVGSTLHWYRIDSVLGQGGFGLTYLATDTNLDQQVALKEYLPIEFATRLPDGSVLARSEELEERYAWGLERFVSEAKMLARFDHPAIVRVHSVFERNNTAYMVMRYEEGQNLESILRGGRELGEKELLDLLFPILDGLEAIHAEGFIHRDIKPDNIYVRTDGSAVLIDFGSARNAAGESRILTILVAPGYAPFEQYYETSSQQGPWTDIYGLGATLYRAVAGRPPADAITRSRGVLGSTKDILVPAVEVGRGRYSRRFLQAIDHALRFAESDRPQSIAEWRAYFAEPDAPAAPAAAGVATLRADEDTREQVTTRPTDTGAKAAAAAAGTGAGRAALLMLVAALAAGAGFLAGRPGALQGLPALAPPGAGSASAPPAAAQDAFLAGRETQDRSAAAALDAQRAELEAARLELARREAALAEGESALTGREQALAREQGVGAERARDAEARERAVAERARALEDERIAVAARERAAAQAQAGADQTAARLERLQSALDEREAQQAREAQRLEAERAELERKRAARDEVTELREQVALLQDRLRSRPAPARARAAPETPPAPAAPAPEATPARPSLEDALRALQQRDYGTARRQLTALAGAGRPQALYHLGVMQLEGLGGAPDAAAGLAFLEQAAAAGLAQAQLRLGDVHASGGSGSGDLAAAVRWYRDAATQGLAEAQLRLGEMYLQGRGVSQDDFLAYTWLAAAAELGQARARPLLEQAGARLQPMEVEQARRLSRQYLGARAAGRD